MNALKRRLLDLIAQEGPISVAHFMSAALYDPEHGYYAQRPAIGGAGDFITASEISQMFGEIVGAWCVQSWVDMGRPDPFLWLELGPGRGTLMADAWRASRSVPEFRAAARVTLLEVNPALKAQQALACAKVGLRAKWLDRLDDAPPGPTLLVANEFLDCLPIRQFVRAVQGWRERLIGAVDGDLTFGLSPGAIVDPGFLPEDLARGAPEGAVAESAIGLPALIEQVGERLRAAPGRALFIDYGAPQTGYGDTLQAVRAHQKVDPLAEPGEADLTAHVDFGRLTRLGAAAGLRVAGPVPQGAWLHALGLAERAAALSASNPDRAESIAADLTRLAGAEAMGELFQVLCLSTPGLSPAAGFS